MAGKKVRETSPLRVWLTVGLLVLVAISYASGVAIMEYFMTAS